MKPLVKNLLIWGFAPFGLGVTFLAGMAVGAGVTLVATVLIHDSASNHNDNARNRNSAILCTLEWARLASFPVDRDQLEIKVTGSPFTRTFEISFTGDPEKIRQWLEDSPGTRGAPWGKSQLWYNHQVDPVGGGAIFATVSASPDFTKVRVKAVWS